MKPGSILVALVAGLSAMIALRLVGPAPLARAAECDVRVHKEARPETVVLGDEVSITMTVQADCDRRQAPTHAVLVFDNSLDMGGSRMGHMREAVPAFADAVGLDRSKVGLVSYHGTVEVLSGLTSDRAALEEAARRFFPRPGSDLRSAVATAGQVLVDAREPGVLEAIVILSGSVSDGEPDDLIAAAEAWRRQGVLVVTVAGTGNADIDTLERMASSPAAHYIESQSVRYPSLFAEIGRDMTAVRITGADVTDELSAAMPYVWGSGIPAPRVRDGQLVWTYAVWPSDGLTITYAVEPQELGRHETSLRSEVELRFEHGAPVTQSFPVSRVQVVSPPTPTQAPPTPAPSPTPTAAPGSLYLPALSNRSCAPKPRPSHVVVLVDTGLTMWDRTEAGGVKLEYVQRAATGFVGTLRLPYDRASVVGFGDEASVLEPLTGDRVSLEVALARLYGHASRGSRLHRGLMAASAQLAGSGVAGADPVVVFVTDGVQDDDEAVAVAADLRRHADVYGIGIGAAVSEDWLARVTGSTARAYRSMDGRDVSRYLGEVRRHIVCRADPP